MRSWRAERKGRGEKKPFHPSRIKEMEIVFVCVCLCVWVQVSSAAGNTSDRILTTYINSVIRTPELTSFHYHPHSSVTDWHPC